MTVGLMAKGSAKVDVLFSSVGRSSRTMSWFSTGIGCGFFVPTGGARHRCKSMGRKGVQSLQYSTLTMNVLVNEINLSIAHMFSLNGGLNLCGMGKMKK